MNIKEADEAVAQSTAPKITQEHVEACVVEEHYHQFPGTTLIMCCLVLKNGFTVTGEAACASPENFVEEIGKTYARRAAEQKIWGLEAYLLREKLSQGTI